MNPAHATLLVSCRDRTGLVAALSDFVFRHGGNIVDLDQHAESGSGWFFMRLVWDLAAFKLDRAGISASLAALSARFELRFEVSYSDVRPRIAVFASTAAHCLYDLLLCQQLGELGGEVVAVVANHPDLAGVAAHFDVPFRHVPMAKDMLPAERATAEAAQAHLLEHMGVDLVVLARYMQIIPPALVTKWAGRMINIHHSFLPAFVGAKPYHQAKERGVKLIGATAHYVTEELDQGPIIEQDVSRVSHRDEVADLQRKGRELERQVLTRAVRLHLARRVLVSGNRTIVFA